MSNCTYPACMMGGQGCDTELVCTKEDMFTDMEKSFMDTANKTLYANVCDEAYHNEPLSLEAVNKLVAQLKPQQHIFVVACDHLPDDCYGILYIRTEDAKQWKSK